MPGPSSAANTAAHRATTMPAAVLHGPGDVRVEDRPVPQAGARQVVVEVSHCGICGTDLHMAIEGWGRPGSVGGHEWSGTVAATGDDVTRVAVGDAVVGGPTPACDRCEPCRAGRPSLCMTRGTPGVEAGADGAFARYVLADERAVVPVPAGLDLRTAALAEPLAVALHAVTRSGVAAGQRALVTGAGPIGTLAVVALQARGVTDIVVSEPHPLRQELARRLGAVVVDPSDLEVPSIAEPNRVVDGAVDVALECSGRAEAMVAAAAQLRRGGTLVLVGTGVEPPRFDPNRILLNELVVTGAFEYDAGGIDDAVALLASGGADVRTLVEPDDVGLDGLLDAMQGLHAGRVAGKVLVSPGATSTPGADDR